MKKLLLVLLALPLIGFGQQTYVPDNNFEAYLEVYGMGDGISGNDSVYTANINTVTYLNVTAQNIADLTGIEAFTDLSYLYCGYNQLTSLNVSGATALSYLYCHYNHLTSLDVSQNTALTELYCAYNQLTSLNVNGATALTHLWCEYNQLTSLNVNGATALTTLYCHQNQLTSLDVSQNTALSYLYCHYNHLTSLDLSQNTALTWLLCYNNQLTSLDVRVAMNGNNTNLNVFYAQSGGVTAVINASACGVIETARKYKHKIGKV